MDFYLQMILYATLTTTVLLDMVKARGDDLCHNITTEFTSDPEGAADIVHINSNIIGIPDETEVEIRCNCLAPRRRSPEWSYNDIDNVTTNRDWTNPSSPYVDYNGPRATLVINSFGEQSSGLYTCHSRDTTTHFNLTWYDPENRPQLVVQPMDLNIHIVNGSEVAVLQCIAFGANTYTWEWQGGTIPTKAVPKEGGTILEIPNIRREEAGDYRCVARNSAGASTSQYAQITVTEELKIVTDPVDVTQRIGTTVTLTCSSEGFQSENFIYFWTNSSDYPVYTEASSSGTSNFVIPAVGPSDSGRYRCIVQNQWRQQVMSNTANIQVETPESFPPITMPTGSTDQFSVTLNWELSAVDVDLVDKAMISTEWTSLLVYDSVGTNGRRQVAGNRATLTISDPTITQHTFTDLQPFSHYCFTVTALYAFEGQALGEVTAEPFCTNTSEAVPSAPQDVTVVTRGFTSLTLIWAIPQSPNGIILNYTIKYNDEVIVVAVEDAKSTFVLSQLPTGTTYDISVSATNSAGEGIYSNIITTKTLSKTATSNDTKDHLLFQVKIYLDGIQSCFTWVNDDHRHLITSAVVDLIRTECNCVLEEEAIDQGHLLCDQSQLDKTVFRAEIMTYQLARDDLLIIIQNMVTGGRLTLNESTVFRVDDKCPVEITSFSDPLCVAIPTTSGAGGTDTKSDEGLPVAAIVGSIIGVIALIILLVVFLLLLVLYRRGKKSNKNTTLEEEKSTKELEETETSVPAIVYSTPLSMTPDPVQKDCQVGIDGYLIPVSNRMENSINMSINDVEFDDDIYLKAINNKSANASKHSDVKMQANPSYRGATIPYNEST